MKSQVLLTVWCNISGGAGGEIWHWSLSGVKGLSSPFRQLSLLTFPSLKLFWISLKFSAMKTCHENVHPHLPNRSLCWPQTTVYYQTCLLVSRPAHMYMGHCHYYLRGQTTEGQWCDEPGRECVSVISTPFANLVYPINFLKLHPFSPIFLLLSSSLTTEERLRNSQNNVLVLKTA